jgi:hypothetical protein
LPLHEWERIKFYETKRQLDCVSEGILQEILTTEGTMVDLRIFMDIIDLFTLLPISKSVVKN